MIKDGFQIERQSVTNPSVLLVTSNAARPDVNWSDLKIQSRNHSRKVKPIFIQITLQESPF